MFRLNDLILLLVIFSSMLVGILFPEPASVFQPYPLYLMMFLLFLSFLPIELDDIWRPETSGKFQGAAVRISRVDDGKPGRSPPNPLFRR